MTSLRLFASWRLRVILFFEPVDAPRDAVLDQGHAIQKLLDLLAA